MSQELGYAKEISTKLGTLPYLFVNRRSFGKLQTFYSVPVTEHITVQGLSHSLNHAAGKLNKPANCYLVGEVNAP